MVSVAWLWGPTHMHLCASGILLCLLQHMRACVWQGSSCHLATITIIVPTPRVPLPPCSYFTSEPLPTHPSLLPMPKPKEAEAPGPSAASEQQPQPQAANGAEDAAAAAAAAGAAGRAEAQGLQGPGGPGGAGVQGEGAAAAHAASGHALPAATAGAAVEGRPLKRQRSAVVAGGLAGQGGVAGGGACSPGTAAVPVRSPPVRT